MVSRSSTEIWAFRSRSWGPSARARANLPTIGGGNKSCTVKEHEVCDFVLQNKKASIPCSGSVEQLDTSDVKRGGNASTLLWESATVSWVAVSCWSSLHKFFGMVESFMEVLVHDVSGLQNNLVCLQSKFLRSWQSLIFLSIQHWVNIPKDQNVRQVKHYLYAGTTSEWEDIAEMTSTAGHPLGTLFERISCKWNMTKFVMKDNLSCKSISSRQTHQFKKTQVSEFRFNLQWAYKMFYVWDSWKPQGKLLLLQRIKTIHKFIVYHVSISTFIDILMFFY